MSVKLCRLRPIRPSGPRIINLALMPNPRILKCTLRRKIYTTRIAPLLADWLYCSLSLFLTKKLKFLKRKKIWDIKPFDSWFAIQHLLIHSSVYLLHWLHRRNKCILAVLESSWNWSLDCLRLSLWNHAGILINSVYWWRILTSKNVDYVDDTIFVINIGSKFQGLLTQILYHQFWGKINYSLCHDPLPIDLEHRYRVRNNRNKNNRMFQLLNSKLQKVSFESNWVSVWWTFS